MIDTKLVKISRDDADPRGVKTLVWMTSVFDDDGWKGGFINCQVDVCEDLRRLDDRYNMRLIAVAKALNDLSEQILKGVKLDG